MKFYPIIFDATSVRAILAGEKTQTRRIVKLNRAGELPTKCPYGEPGDQLWCREQHSFLFGLTAKDILPVRSRKTSPIWYWADGQPEKGDWTRPRPSIYMPRWASRITLERTEPSRIERVQDITLGDAIAEGLMPHCKKSALAEFPRRWNGIHGAGAWEQNNMVWVVTFPPIEPVSNSYKLEGE
jgi:hypothetical protein